MFPRPILQGMRLAVQQINPLDSPLWDLWVKDQPGATVFHTSRWARVLQEVYGFKPTYFAAEGEDGSRVLLPMMEVDSWLTGRRGISLPFSDACSPLGASEESFPTLFNAVREHAETRRWKSIECRGGLPFVAGAQASSTYWAHWLDLNTDEGGLFARFDSAVRRAIRKAEKSGVTIELTHSDEAIEAYFRLQCLTRRRHGLPPQPAQFFTAVRDQILNQGLGYMIVARHAGRIVSAAIFFHLGREALYKFGASDEAFQHLRPTNLVLWTAIQQAARLGMERLHFGRNALQHESLRRFKLSWGTVEDRIQYLKYDCATHGFVPNRDLLNGWQNHVFRRLPIGLGRVIGSLLYRHIA